MQTEKTMIRRRVLWRLIWVYSICQCPFYAGLKRLIKTMDIFFFSSFFFLFFFSQKKKKKKNLCRGYSLEAFLMSTHNVRFCWEIRKYLSQRTTKPTIKFCDQLRHRSACASTQSDQSLRWSDVPFIAPSYPKRDKREPLQYWADVQAGLESLLVAEVLL